MRRADHQDSRGCRGLRARRQRQGNIKRGTVAIEKWTYDRGSQSFAMVVTIVDGEIQSMERGE